MYSLRQEIDNKSDNCSFSSLNGKIDGSEGINHNFRIAKIVYRDANDQQLSENPIIQ